MKTIDPKYCFKRECQQLILFVHIGENGNEWVIKGNPKDKIWKGFYTRGDFTTVLHDVDDEFSCIYEDHCSEHFLVDKNDDEGLIDLDKLDRMKDSFEKKNALNIVADEPNSLGDYRKFKIMKKQDVKRIFK